MRLNLLILALTSACFSQTCPPPAALIDDFSEGQGIIMQLHHANEAPPGKTQTGQNMLGCERFIVLSDTFNLFNGPAELDITKDDKNRSAVQVTAGVRVGATLVIAYGQHKPLHMTAAPGGSDRVRATIDSVSRPVTLIVEMETPNIPNKPFERYMGVISLPASGLSDGPFCADIPYAAFRGTANGSARLSFEQGIDRIVVEVAPVGIVEANSYAITKLEFASNSPNNKCLVAPIPK